MIKISNWGRLSSLQNICSKLIWNQMIDIQGWLSIHSSHASHSPHTSHSVHASHGHLLLLGLVYDHAFGSGHVSTYWCCVFQSNSHHFGGVDDASCDEINKFSFAGIETEISVNAFIDLLNGGDAFEACVIWDGLAGKSNGFFDDVNSKILLWVGSFDLRKDSSCV